MARSTKPKTARVFWIGGGQAVRLPKEFRFDTTTVLVRREGNTVILESRSDWPVDYIESFAGVPDDFERPSQGGIEKDPARRA